VPFAQVGPAMYEVTLGPYGFYWFELLEHSAEAIEVPSTRGTL
jgi:hypothetical protein